MNDASPGASVPNSMKKAFKTDAVFKLSINQFENSIDVSATFLEELVFAIEDRVKIRKELKGSWSEIEAAHDFLMIRQLGIVGAFLITSAERFGPPPPPKSTETGS